MSSTIKLNNKCQLKNLINACCHNWKASGLHLLHLKKLTSCMSKKISSYTRMFFAKNTSCQKTDKNLVNFISAPLWHKCKTCFMITTALVKTFLQYIQLCLRPMTLSSHLLINDHYQPNQYTLIQLKLCIRRGSPFHFMGP